MLKYIKSRQQLYNDAYKKGYRNGEHNTEKRLQAKIDLIIEDRKKAIKRKNAEIKARDKYVDKIESGMQNFRGLVVLFEQLVERLADSKNGELLTLTNEFQEIHRAEGEIQSIVRHTRREYDKVEEKIEKYKVERLN